MNTLHEARRLGDVCQFINGRAYSKEELLSKGKYPVLRVGNFFTNNHWYFSDLELDENKYCDTGDLLYAWSASFGPKIWDGGKVIYHYHIWKVVPNKNLVTKEFLYYLLDWDKDQIKVDQGAGTTMTHVSKGSMDDRLVNLPRIPEQQRIVAMLDESFAALARVKENAEKNLVNARELFEAVLQDVFVSITEKATVGDLCDLLTGFSFKSSDYVEASNTMNFRMSQIRPGGWVDLENNSRYLPDQFAERYKEYLLEDGDIVIAMTDMATETKILGVPTLVRTDERSLLLNQRVGKFTNINYEQVDIPYLKYVLSSKPVNNYYKKLGRGGLQINIGKQDILDAQIPLPSLPEQRAIVTRLDALSAETKKLEGVYRQKLAALEELKKSILQKAFEGGL